MADHRGDHDVERSQSGSHQSMKEDPIRSTSAPIPSHVARTNPFSTQSVPNSTPTTATTITTSTSTTKPTLTKTIHHTNASSNLLRLPTTTMDTEEKVEVTITEAMKATSLAGPNPSTIPSTTVTNPFLNLPVASTRPNSTPTPFATTTTTNTGASTASIKSQSPKLSQHIRNRPKRITPNTNVPEHILFVIDLSTSMKDPCTSANTKITVLNAVQRAIDIFVNVKHGIDNNHKFGLACVVEDPLMLLEFTSDLPQFVDMVKHLAPQELGSTQPDTLDLTKVLKMIGSQVGDRQQLMKQRPEVVVRAIVIHARSEVPTWDNREESTWLLDSPGFYMDFVHFYAQRGDHKERVQEYKDFYDKNFDYPYFYKFIEPKEMQTIFPTVAKLHAHPLQRNNQNDLCYSLEDMEKDNL
eukprot:m.97658 g.97658  ORF g.97658 m.97658 type:complete len:412 (-) comp26998_c0_seq1:423-1658(-)